MRYIFIITTVLSVLLVAEISLWGQAQTPARDKLTLLTMPYNERPLTLYRGQFQANASYKFAVRSKSYDSDGEMISLKENGAASIIHSYILEVKYGITDFIEIGAESFYLRNGIRSESNSILSGSDVISTNTLNELKGFGDVTLSAAVRLPIEYKVFDVSLRGGISLPIASYKPSEPTHSIDSYKSPNNFTVNYHFNNNNGNGVPLYYISGAAKFTYHKVSVEARSTYRIPVREGENIRWDWTFSGADFSYYSKPFQYYLSRSLSVQSSIHYQAAGWLDIFVNGNYLKTTGGWTENYGLKYANAETSLLTIEPVFELQISPSLTIYQTAGFPLTGVSTDSPFYLLTTLSFNMFPFIR